jgi:hypothetical protein
MSCPSASPLRKGRAQHSPLPGDRACRPNCGSCPNSQHRVTEQSHRNFFDDQWKVAPEADRMGYRSRGGRPLQFVERDQPFGAGSDPSNIVDGVTLRLDQMPGGASRSSCTATRRLGGSCFMVGRSSADMT